MKQNSSAPATRDACIAFIRSRPDGADPVELAEAVLKFKSPARILAKRMIDGILSSDRRCIKSDSGLWLPSAVTSNENETPVAEMPWSAVFTLSEGINISGTLKYVSVWELFPEPRPIISCWISDPEKLHPEEHDILCSPFDLPYSGARAAIESIAAGLESLKPVFICGRHQESLAGYFESAGESFPEDTMLTSSLMKICKLSVARPITSDNIYKSVFDMEPSSGSAYRQAENFALCVSEILRRIMDSGIETGAGLEPVETTQDTAVQWPNFNFPAEGIRGLPDCAGVYGFKDSGQAVIYVGKAKNLRRRLSGYFRSTDEPDAKLTSLRTTARDLIIHKCGSELESLVLEYRLIRKHRPALNKQVSIDERKGSYSPVPDCIVLLPDADSGRGMSVWIRKDQKITLKAFDPAFPAGSGLTEEINSYFFGPSLPPAPGDFPEMEIVNRWVKRHGDDIQIVPVHRCSGAEEILEYMKSMWEEVKGFHQAG